MSQHSSSPPDLTEEANSVVVYPTGFLCEFDIVTEALTCVGIPYFRRVESIGGLSCAMPVLPTMGPGTLWAVVVPESWADRARHFIARLPVPHGTEPHVWSSSAPSQEMPPRFYWAWVFGIGAAILLVWSFIRALVNQ